MKGGNKMPYIITKSIYPSDKATEVANKYLEALSKYPHDEKLATQVVPAAVKSTHQGIQVMGILDIKQGKLEEAITYIGNFMTMFHSIQGFESTIDVYFKVEEAMELLGMSLPK
jgi:hypothetical protein